jgi:threonylcarbamoyladenosine tRNA methylthiotransferase MtaB
MIALGKQLGIKFRTRMLGKTTNVLVEESREGTDGHLAGFTENYLRVLMDVSDSAVNRILPAKLTGMEGEFIRAEANGFHTDID